MKIIERSGLTMTELARKAGISRTGLYLWLRRDGLGKATTAQRLAKALGITVEELLAAKGKRK